MPTVYILEINHVEQSGMEWNLLTEEVLGGQGRSTLIVQDRTNTWEPQQHWDVKLSIRSSGKVLFRGEILRTPVELPVGMPFRKWKLLCSDYSGQFPQRKIGAFDGVTWQDVDGLGDYVNIDINGHSLATDKLTIQALFDKYIRVDGVAINTTTFVDEYLTDFGPIYWAYSDLEAVLNELASQIAQNVQYWLDPDLNFHWKAIPAWQDLAQQAAGIAANPTTAVLAQMIPELPPATLVFSSITGISDVPVGNEVGGRELKFEFDGGSMPEQVYVRGATGYVYNAGAPAPAGERVTIDPQGYGSQSTDKFQLTFLATTKVWQKLSSGLISSIFSTIVASGPFNVTFIRVPYNPANGKGGHFWKLLNGPKAGWLVDNDTNYFGYGSILVEQILPSVGAATTPTVGIGGSGWAGGVTQDLTKRQAYLEAAISVDQSTREAVGGQVLYRGRRPTLRGSIKVTGGTDDNANVLGPDGYRVGELIKITDARLPTSLNGRYFIIQRVEVSAIAASDVREYVLDWGDGPTSRYTWKPKVGSGAVTWPSPATQVLISTFDLSPGPNSSQTIYGQLANKAGQPWQIAGKVVKWTLEVYNSAGALVTGQGSLTPSTSATDAHGRARVVLKTGATTGLVYFVFANVAAT